ncbi:helix-turn-helix domain-containing protein [Agrobacterium sp. 22-226-1]
MKRSEIPSLDDLRAFETVARLGSVRAAAIELSLTHGAVSAAFRSSHAISASVCSKRKDAGYG